MCWNRLKNLYESNNNARRLMLGNHLYNINIGEGANTEKFFLRVKNMHIQIGGIDGIMKDEDVVLIVLNALPLVLKVLCRMSLPLCPRMNYCPLINFPKNYYKTITEGPFEGRNVGRTKS